MIQTYGQFAENYERKSRDLADSDIPPTQAQRDELMDIYKHMEILEQEMAKTTKALEEFPLPAAEGQQRSQFPFEFWHRHMTTWRDEVLASDSGN